MKPDDKLVEHVLITRCQLRDRQALAELIERHEQPVRYFIRRLVNNAGVADELFQDTWLTVIRRIHALENPERFTVWLYRIARNRVYQEFRRCSSLLCPSPSLCTSGSARSRYTSFRPDRPALKCISRR